MDVSSTEETWNSDTAPVARRAPNTKPTAGHPEPGHPHIHDRQTAKVHKGTRHMPETEKKHGGGKANWGSDKDAALEAEAEMGAVPCAPGEEKLEPESPEEERRALEEAGVPPAPTNKAHILDVKI